MSAYPTEPMQEFQAKYFQGLYCSTAPLAPSRHGMCYYKLSAQDTGWFVVENRNKEHNGYMTRRPAFDATNALMLDANSKTVLWLQKDETVYFWMPLENQAHDYVYLNFFGNHKPDFHYIEDIDYEIGQLVVNIDWDTFTGIMVDPEANTPSLWLPNCDTGDYEVVMQSHKGEYKVCACTESVPAIQQDAGFIAYALLDANAVKDIEVTVAHELRAMNILSLHMQRTASAGTEHTICDIAIYQNAGKTLLNRVAYIKDVNIPAGIASLFCAKIFLPKLPFVNVDDDPIIYIEITPAGGDATTACQYWAFLHIEGCINDTAIVT